MSDLIAVMGRWWRDPVCRARVIALAGAMACGVILGIAPDPSGSRVCRRLGLEGDPGWWGGVAHGVRVAFDRGAGENLKAEDWAALTLGPAAALNGAICVLLALTASFWARPLDGGSTARAGGVRGRWGGALWWGALFCAVALALVTRWPLAHGGLWWDEVWTLRRAVVGERQPDQGDPSRLTFKEVTWARTFWNYSKPTNHVGFSVLSRLSLGAWRAVTGRETHEFDEFAMRFPAVAAALLSVIVLALLLRDWGWPRAGIAAAFLLALHPWHIRYGVDARAFSFLVCFGLCASYALARALRSGAWGWWLAYGWMAFLLLWSFPHALFAVGALCGCGLIGALLAGGGLTRAGRVLAGRLVISSMLAGMLFFQMAAPWFPQVSRWVDVAGNEMVTWAFVRQFWVTLVAGMPEFEDPSPEAAGLASVAGVARGFPHVWAWVWVIVPALVAAGLARVGARRAGVVWVVVAWVLVAPVALGVALVGTQYFYDRYLIYVLPFVVAGACVGSEWIAGALGRLLPGGARVWSVAGLVGLVLFWGGITAPARRVLATRPYAPTREVAGDVRGRSGADPLAAVRVGCGLGGDTPSIYDPWIRWVVERGELVRELESARRAGKPLFCFYGYNSFNRARAASGEGSIFGILDDPTVFRPVASHAGIEAQFFYRILEYTGAPVPVAGGGG